MPEKLGTALGSQINGVLPPKLECAVAEKQPGVLTSLIFHGPPEGPRVLVCVVLMLAPACRTPWEKQRRATGVDGGERDRERLHFDEPSMGSSTPNCTLVQGVRPIAGTGAGSAPKAPLCLCLVRVHLMSLSG